VRQALGDEAGAGDFMEPRTVEILAIAPTPVLGPNLYADRFSQDEWLVINNDPHRPDHDGAIVSFYAPGSIARAFPLLGRRKRTQWTIYNMFMKRGSETDRKLAVAEPTPEPELAPVPPILPIKREWREPVLEAIGPGPHMH